MAAILFVVGHPLFVRWQLRQHGWVVDSGIYARGRLPEWVPELAIPWFGQIVDAKLERSVLRMNDLGSLREFRQLESLHLISTDVSEQHLAAASQLSPIFWLSFDDVQLESSGLRHLAALPKLEVLR